MSRCIRPDSGPLCKRLSKTIGTTDQISKPPSPPSSHTVHAACADLDKQPFVCFSDANFADAADYKLRSTSGYCIYFFGSLTAWDSKRQSITSRSTLEAELIAAASASEERVWIFHFAQTVPFFSVSITPLPPR